MRTLNQAAQPILNEYWAQVEKLIESLYEGDAEAARRIEGREVRFFRPARYERPRLDYQSAGSIVAEENGFSNWEALKQDIARSTATLDDDAKDFIRLAYSGKPEDTAEAVALLQETPAVATYSFHTALVLGDVALVEKYLDREPDLVSMSDGLLRIEPLQYACHSRLGNLLPESREGILKTAQFLLGRGANPRACIKPRIGECAIYSHSCFFGAVLRANDLRLASLLIEHGAIGDDREALKLSIHRSGRVAFDFLADLASPDSASYALDEALFFGTIDMARRLLEAGADANKSPRDLSPRDRDSREAKPLHRAIFHKQGVEVANMLIDYGANAFAENKWGGTIYDDAVGWNKLDVADVFLARSGVAISPLHAYLRRCAGATDEEMREIAREFPELASSRKERPEDTLHRFVYYHDLEALRAVLAAGYPIDAYPEFSMNALQTACESGYEDGVEILLKYGASLNPKGRPKSEPIPDFFILLVKRPRGISGDAARIARMLLAAGATFDPKNLPTKNDAVDAVLREHGVIE